MAQYRTAVTWRFIVTSGEMAPYKRMTALNATVCRNFALQENIVRPCDLV